MNDFLEKVNRHFLQDLPFVVYNKPNATKLIGIFQHNNTLYLVKNFSETGFIFAPFDGKEIVLIPKNQAEIVISDFVAVANDDSIVNVDLDLDDKSEDESKFEALVQKGIDAIAQGIFSKVVLSRKEVIDLPNFDIIKVIKKLFDTYPTAFSYCFYHPKVGLWLGAFSEQLLKKEGNVFYTMAVAGTQQFMENENIVWGNKEKEEQQFVTDFILENLKKDASDIVVSKAYTMRAGNIVHIKTDIKGILNSGSSLQQVLDILHPTPAVCGLPKQMAKDFILLNEGYKREYYSGYLGEMNLDFRTFENSTDLYVNLRCMRIAIALAFETTKAHLYVGCGITKDSRAEKEWRETVNKSMTIKKILS